MVIHDLDVHGTFLRPYKANPELIVDPDRMLALSVARQCFQPVTRWSTQIGELGRSVQVAQLPACHFDQAGRKALRTFAGKDRRRGFVAKTSDHNCLVSWCDTSVKRDVSSNDTCGLPAPRWRRAHGLSMPPAGDEEDARFLFRLCAVVSVGGSSEGISITSPYYS